MSISFTANFVNKATIQQRSTIFGLRNVPVSIVEINKNDVNDVNSLRKAAYNWSKNGGRGYATNIYHETAKTHQYPGVLREHFYALTTQSNDFETLRPNKIQGLMLLEEAKSGYNEIAFLEVNPKTNHKSGKGRKYKKIGTALVDFVKNKFKDKNIYVQSDYGAIDFYKKNKFSQISPDSECLLQYKV